MSTPSKETRVFLANAGMRPENLMVIPPLGILSIAAYIRTRMPVALEIFNQRLNNTPNSELVARVARFKPEVIGLTTMTSSVLGLPQLTQMLRDAVPNALIVIGGPHVSACGEDALVGTQADVAVAGEGEAAFEAIVKVHRDGGDLDNIPGIYLRQSDGSVRKSLGETPLIKNLDDLPFPAFDLIDLSAYWRVQSGIASPKRGRSITVFTSRGCPYKCYYCHDVFGKRFRQLSAERVVDEIQHYVEQYGVEEVDVLDDIFNLNPRRVLEFSSLLKQRNINVRLTFPNGLRTDILREDVIDALVDAGAYYAAFPLETASPRLQQITQKDLNIPKWRTNLDYAVSKGIFSCVFNMVGFPTETEEEMRLTIETACDTPAHIAYFQAPIPYPGTPLHGLAKEIIPGLEDMDFEGVSFRSAGFNLSEIPDKKFWAIKDSAWQKFYLRPRRMARIIRDHPAPQYLPLYLPVVGKRIAKGVLASLSGAAGSTPSGRDPQQPTSVES